MDDVGSKKEIIRGKAKAPTLSALLKGEDESDNEEKKAAEEEAQVPEPQIINCAPYNPNPEP